jgi:hypothetical protein
LHCLDLREVFFNRIGEVHLPDIHQLFQHHIGAAWPDFLKDHRMQSTLAARPGKAAKVKGVREGSKTQAILDLL